MSEPSVRRRRDLFTGLGLSAAALLVAFTGGLISPTGWLTPSQSPTIFPAGCLLGVAVCGLIIARGSTASSQLSMAAPMSLRAVGIGVVMAIYAVALPYAGLIIATVALLLTVPLLFRYVKWVPIISFGIVLIGGIWLIFIELMNVQLKL